MPFFRNQRQYQVKVDPLVPVVFEDRWHQSWSEPVRQKIAARLSIALIVSGLSAPAFTPTPVVAAVENTTLSSQVVFNGRFQYQAYTAPTFVPPETITIDKWNYAWSEPVRVKINPQRAAALAAPYSAFVPLVQIPVTTATSPVIFQRSFQYQTVAEPAFTPVAETVTIDKWTYPWSEPVRQKIGLRSSLQQAVIAPVLADDQITGSFESRWHQPWSEPVRVKPRLRDALQKTTSFVNPTATTDSLESRWHQGWSEPVRFRRFPTAEQQSLIFQPPIIETITFDKWGFQLSEPVRFKRIPTALQQSAAIGPVLEPETQISQDYESRWHYPWSEPVRIKQQAPAGEQQFLIQGPPKAPEFITVDKWIYPWTDPVRQKIGLKTHLQQAFIAPVLNPDTQISQDFESRWHFPWSEPVRVKRPLLTAQQQALALNLTLFEYINTDKWNYAWSEPVRRKPPLLTAQQQALAYQGLRFDTVTIDKWNYAWSEPVRFRRFPTAEQQSLAYQGLRFDIVTVDKWFAPLRDPVKQKIWLKTHLQQALIAPVLNPQTQILVGSTSAASSRVLFKKRFIYQSLAYAPFTPAEIVTSDKWNYAWSEPVRFRRFPTAEQQSQVQGPPQTPELVNADKWIYPLSEPVRQKIGLKTHLQQALIAPVLNPETQIIQGLESRWHQPWSEPIRFRRFATAEQQSLVFQTALFEVINIDKWGYPWTEPVRQKRGLGVVNQPSFFWSNFTPVVVEVNEAQWHQPWSEPVRQKLVLRANLQQNYTFVAIPRGVAPVITVTSPVIFHQSFIYQSQFLPAPVPLISTAYMQAFAEPVRLKVGLRPYLQQTSTFVAIPTPIPVTSITTPVIFHRWFQYQSIVPPVPQPIYTIDKWGYAWSEPVRKKPGLGAWLQRATTPETPPYELLIRTIPWFEPLNEPVRLKIGLGSYLQRWFTAGTDPIANPFTFTLSATEVNADSALFGILTYNVVTAAGVPTIIVSIKEIPFIGGPEVSIEEEPDIENADVSIKEI